jgi:hypothetical protein
MPLFTLRFDVLGGLFFRLDLGFRNTATGLFFDELSGERDRPPDSPPEIAVTDCGKLSDGAQKDDRYFAACR